MFASTSRVARVSRPFTRLASNTSSSSSAAASTRLVPDSLPVSPPTDALPASPLPEAYRASTASSTPTSSVPNPFAAVRPAQRGVNPFAARPTPSQRVPPKKYRLSVFSTRNNTILTLTTRIGSGSSSPSSSSSSGSRYEDYSLDSSSSSSSSTTDSVVAWVSAGSAGYKGASKGTYDAAVEVSIKMFNKIRQLRDMANAPEAGMRKKNQWPVPTELELVWNGFGQGRDAVFRTLMAGDGDKVKELVSRVTDATPLKVGGTRPKKRRVV